MESNITAQFDPQDTPKECRMYPIGTLNGYKFADIFAVYEGKWIFCRQKVRTTWENPGGYIDSGETPLEAAKRELFEETGAVDFDIEPLCDTWIYGEVDGVDISARGQTYFAKVHTLANLPEEWEMEQLCFVDTPPLNLTYPEYTRKMFPLAVQKMKSAL